MFGTVLGRPGAYKLRCALLPLVWTAQRWVVVLGHAPPDCIFGASMATGARPQRNSVWVVVMVAARHPNASLIDRDCIERASKRARAKEAWYLGLYKGLRGRLTASTPLLKPVAIRSQPVAEPIWSFVNTRGNQQCHRHCSRRVSEALNGTRFADGHRAQADSSSSRLHVHTLTLKGPLALCFTCALGLLSLRH